LHPLHAILLAFPVALFTAALITDIAYFNTAQIQWANFASWLIAGGLFVGAFPVLWALIHVLRRWRSAGRGHIVYLFTLLAMWLLGFIDALVHAKDAWAAMPTGLYLSAVVTILALGAAWVGHSQWRVGDVR
jgi:uncharacterized membrane protein